MKVELKIYEQGGIDCLSKDCAFRKECANHETAGDYRSEDGFTPDLYEKNGGYFCNTFDERIMDIDFTYATCDRYPANYNQLSRGALNKKNLEAKANMDEFEVYFLDNNNEEQLDCIAAESVVDAAKKARSCNETTLNKILKVENRSYYRGKDG
jgi:hypothetical protein